MKWLIRRTQYHSRDIWNRLKFGSTSAPVSFETIWIDPSSVRFQCRSFRRRYSGRVLDGDWDLLNRRPVSEHTKIIACKKHFIENASWEDVGIIEYMLDKIERLGQFDECTQKKDVIIRCRRLDELYESLQSGGDFKTMSEIDPKNFREQGGIHIHIGRSGELLFGGGGCHRLAIAQILKLTRIPAQLGVCHAQAVANGLIEPLRYRYQ